MVRSAPKPSLREASCCKVLVANGGAGWRCTCFFSTLSTRNCRASIAATARLASASFARPNLSSLLPSSMLRRAWKSAPLGVVNAAWMLQYSCGLNASISFSRSQIRRSATDCTRPAEREPCSLRQSTGDSVKPTR